MIKIHQGSSLDIDLNNRHSEYVSSAIRFSVPEIHIAAEELERKRNDTNNRNDRGNIRALRKYLDLLLEGLYAKGVKDETGNSVDIDIEWRVADRILEAGPVKFLRYPEYDVCTSRFISIQQEKMVVMNTRDVADAIAFEIMHRDLGFSHDRIELELADAGLTNINEYGKLKKLFEGSEVYMLSKMLRLGESPYKTIGAGNIYGYFGHGPVESDTYWRVVEKSCLCASSILMGHIMEWAHKNDIDMRLCGVYADSLYISFNDDSKYEEIVERFSSVAVRVCGRMFEASVLCEII